MGINTSNEWIHEAIKSLLCKSGTIPFTYLGLPIGSNLSRIQAWNPIIEKLSKKASNMERQDVVHWREDYSYQILTIESTSLFYVPISNPKRSSGKDKQNNSGLIVEWEFEKEESSTYGLEHH